MYAAFFTERLNVLIEFLVHKKCFKTLFKVVWKLFRQTLLVQERPCKDPTEAVKSFEKAFVFARETAIFVGKNSVFCWKKTTNEMRK